MRAMPPTATRSRACSNFAASSVEREFYVNDAGSQVRTFGESIQALARGEQPAGGRLSGRLRRRARAAHRGRRDEPIRPTLGRAAVAMMVGEIQASLAAFGVERVRPLGVRERAARGRAEPRRRARSRVLDGARAHLHAATARCGCAARASATTRTACSCAPTASTRTSRRTSPTTRTSASAASTA